MYQNFIVPYLYEAQHVSGDTPPIIRSLKLHCQPLVFHSWEAVWTCSWWTLSGTVCLTTSTNYTFKQPPTNGKPEAGSAILGSWWHSVPDNVHHLHVQTASHEWKTIGCQCSFRLLMMDGVSPETCWASYKYGTIKFWYIFASCWIFIYELYYDARIHERQESVLIYFCRINLWADLGAGSSCLWHM